MANKRLDVEKQYEIKRLKGLGYSQRKVAKALKIDRGTVSRFWEESIDENGQSIPDWAKEIDWEEVAQEIRSKTPRKVLFDELSASVDLPSYQAFCQYMRNNLPRKAPEITIKIDRTPGASLEVDYSGDTMQILNPATGEIHNAELFVGAMSFSGHFYAEFTFTQKLEDFIESHNNMFAYFGAVPGYIVPDNCKVAVTTASKTDPKINPTFKDLCEHYGTVVDPADPYSPRHKPNAERAIGMIQKDFFPRMRNKTFTSLGELNQELKKWLTQAKERVVRTKGKTRAELFDLEKEHLRPLPERRYELCYFKRAKVHPDCHFQHLHNYYSVPFHFVGKEIDIKFNSKMVTAYHECNLLSVHKAQKGRGHYSTNPAHYPEKKIVETNYHLNLARKQADKTGPYLRAVVDKVINQARHPLKVLRKVQGIVGLAQKFEKDAMEYACEMAIEFDKPHYEYIKRFARNYRKPEKSNVLQAPKRNLELICLQGGSNE